MIAILFALLLTPPLALDDAAANARLEELRKTFPLRAKALSIAELEQLTVEAPNAPATGRALLWLGDLSLQAGDFSRAGSFYTRAGAFTDPATQRLSRRGRGDVALAQEHFLDARRLYAEALPGAPPILHLELEQKHAVAMRLFQRAVAAWISWVLVTLALGWFLWRIRRGQGPLRPPLEVIYVAPVYALLIVGCLGRDANVLRALYLCAPASMIVIAASGMAARRSPGRPLLHAALVITANLALFYAILYRAGLLDTLLTTIGTIAPG